MLKTPPLQTATATIDTLCGRLESATLLEDRRAAILGLRSFAKQYPASVASGSLRELIAILKRDGLGEAGSTSGEPRRSQEGGDVDTIRLILETLLMLFNPDSSSPEAGDEINFFMADEFSMRQDNISLLLSLLDPTSPYADYYSRLYSVQLLSAICAARPERLQECILSTPLGVSRLVGVLDDGRDAVRNAGLLLLIDLTGGANEELRKIVAFEDVFGRIFALIRLEGGLAEAGITAQDCLSLLANLIKGSASNQAMFRESGCVAQFVQLLQQAFPSDASEAAFIAQSREKAAWGLLQLLRLFFVSGDSGTPQNQTAFFRAGAAQLLIDLSFTQTLPSPIRASALRSSAALIDSNAPLQEQFASLTIATSSSADEPTKQSPQNLQANGNRSSTPSIKNSARPSVESRRTYIIEALLDLALAQNQEDMALRIAACGLIQAYLTQHDRIRAHFLQRAIAGHLDNEPAANVLTCLLQPPEGDSASVVLASWIVQDLIYDNGDAKAALAQVREGNEEEGEDVLTSIQAFGSQLLASLQQSADEKVVAAYASLLTTLLWDFASGVDNLLAEGSSLVQALINIVKTPKDRPLIVGIAATLLGTVYEFSTKDSPIPRRTLAPLLQQKLGRTKYLDALLELRRLPAIRDFELDAETDQTDEGMLCRVFVDHFSLEYSRLRKAIDKDPGVEVLPQLAAEAGVDRDVLDDLRQQIQDAKDALAQSQKEASEASQKSDQDRMIVAKDLQTVSTEVERLRKINQSLQQGHEHELGKVRKQHESDSEKLKKQHGVELEQIKKQSDQQKQTLTAQHQRAIVDTRQEIERQSQATLRERDATSAQKVQELERKLAELGNAHRTEASGHATARQQLDSLTAKHNDLIKRDRDTSQRIDELQRLHGNAEREMQAATSRASKAESELEGMRSSLDARMAEVSDLNNQLKELREEVKSRDEELKTERAGFADLEKELEAARAATTAVAAKSGKGSDKRISDLEKDVKEAKEAEKNAKDELETMLLVMGDIEAKRDVYKGKVKELGGEVTDDDDEDEDDEDDDDDDDDDVD